MDGNNNETTTTNKSKTEYKTKTKTNSKNKKNTHTQMIPPLQCSRQKERALSIFTSRYTAAAHDYNMARVERLNAEDDDEYEYY